MTSNKKLIFKYKLILNWREFMSKIEWDKYGHYDWDNLPDPGKMLKPVKDNIDIYKVGIRGFYSPVDIVRKDESSFRTDGTFSCYVSLKEHLKGTHMSRLAQVMQEVTLDRPITNDTLHHITDELLEKVDTDTVYLKMRFNYPLKQNSLKSRNKKTDEPNFGWMKYPTTIELKKTAGGEAKGFYSIEFLYSSTCPCSFMMSESFREQTGHPATPHAQRSSMLTTVEFDFDSDFHIEDLIEHHREAIKTEVLGSIVKREDELSFAVLNSEQPMFCEDAVRYMYDQLNSDLRILDFSAVANHFESLHDHDATSIVCKGIPGGLR